MFTIQCFISRHRLKIKAPTGFKREKTAFKEMASVTEFALNTKEIGKV